MFTDAALYEAEREHCLRLVQGGPGWDSFVVDKARTLGKKGAYAELTAAVERSIVDAGRKLPQPWDEPAATEVFHIPPRYRLATHIERSKR